MEPTLTVRDEPTGSDGPSPAPLLLWRFPEGRLCVSSAVLGGGIGARSWVVNASVPIDYARTDPDRHLAELATALGLTGPGVGLLTAVDVRTHHTATDGGVHATATVGLSSPAWAAAPDGDFRREHPGGRPPGPVGKGGPAGGVDRGGPVGTVNVVVAVPVRLTDAALVNAVVTATEAKAQAIWEAGVTATGTASDALCVHCPTGDGDPGAGAPEPYAGPRSVWGARIARAVHAAVLTGARRWLGPAGGTAWRP
jgi:adenosylcobinamide amidohydrolase